MSGETALGETTGEIGVDRVGTGIEALFVTKAEALIEDAIEREERETDMVARRAHPVPQDTQATPMAGKVISSCPGNTVVLIIQCWHT